MKAKPNEIAITRVYDAPVKLVWEAWTDLAQISKWWGPRGFTLTTKSKDLRPGGKWIYTMHGPDGVDYPNIATYHEVVPFKKLVYDHGGDETRDKLFTVTVTFEESRGKTTMNMIMALPNEEAAKATAKFVKEANGNSTWDRLGEYLELGREGKDVFIANRTFAADVATVFEMWVNPEHLSRWLPPTGATMKFLKTDVREGGTSHYAMKAADGTLMYGLVSYKHIHPTDFLQYAQSFSNEAGAIAKPYFSPLFPDAMLTTVSFASEDDGQTRVTVRWEVYGNATAEERAFFHQMKDGMSIGWNGSFDKLDEALAQRL